MLDPELLKLEDKKYTAHAKNRAENTDKLIKTLDPVKEATAKMAGFLEQMKGEKGDSPSKEELLKLIEPLIPEPVIPKDGIDGKTPTEDELVGLIKPLIPEPIAGPQGEKGADSTIPGPRGPKGTPGRDGSPDTPEQIAKKLLTLKKAWLQVSAIDGITELLNEAGNNWLSQAKGFVPRALASLYDVNTKGVINGQTIIWDSASQKWIPGTAIGSGTGTGYTVETPTGTINGVNTSFTVNGLPPVYIVSDGVTYFENNGYTLSGSTITLTVPPTSYIRSFFGGSSSGSTEDALLLEANN